MNSIKNITKFNLNETKKVELTPGTSKYSSSRAHFKNRIENPHKFNSLFLLEPGTDHVYDMFFDCQEFLDWAEFYGYRLTHFDYCYTQDYIEAFGKNPVPQRPGYGFNHTIHMYDERGWFIKTTTTQEGKGIPYHIVDGFAKATVFYTKRYSLGKTLFSTFKRERLYTRVFDVYPGFEAECKVKGFEFCDY